MHKIKTEFLANFLKDKLLVRDRADIETYPTT